MPKVSKVIKSHKILFSVLGAIILVGAFLYVFNIDLNVREGLFEKKPAQTALGDKEVSATANAVHSECEAKAQPSEKFDCYGTEFDTFMRAQGGRKTLELLQKVNDLGGYAQTNCHPLSHEVGHIALRVYKTIPAAAPEYLPTCSSGYYHGLLEEYLANVPSYEQGIADACGDPEKEIFFNWFQCTHGEGHGIMQFRDNEVPQSLADCDLLPEAKNAREICYGGVFMENITTEEKTGHVSKYIKKNDPIYPCNGKEIAEKYRSACYFLASSQILKINGYDFRDANKWCATVEDNYRWLCFQSLGRDVSGATLRNIPQVIEKCQYGIPSDNANCFYGAVRDFVNEKGEFDTGIDLCNQVPNDYKKNCFEAIFLDLGLYKTGQAFLDVCDRTPQPYRDQCRAKLPQTP